LTRIGVAEIVLKTAEELGAETVSLEGLAVLEMRRVLARKQVLERRIRLAKPELAEVVERLGALDVLAPDRKKRFGMEALVAKVDREMRRWESTFGYYSGPSVSGMSAKLSEFGLGPTIEDLEEHSEEIADILDYLNVVEIPTFWYMLRVDYKDDIAEMLDKRGEILGLQKKSRTAGGSHWL
jgi:hypothetical protein